MSEENVEELVKFCYEERITLMADEVYQILTYREDRWGDEGGQRGGGGGGRGADVGERGRRRVV